MPTLDQHQLRHWVGWHRFTVLAMLALAFLAAWAALTPPPGPYHHATAHHGPIRLSVNELRRLFTALVNAVVHTVAHHLRWSLWRRTHQAGARRSHYKRRLPADIGT